MKNLLQNQEIKHNQEMDQMKIMMHNDMKNIINKLQNSENMIKEDLRVQAQMSEVKMEKRFQIIEKAISDLQNNYTNLRNEISDVKRDEQKLNSISSLLNQISNKLTEINKEKNLSEIIGLKKKIEDIASKLIEFLKGNNTLADKYTALCQQISNLIDEIKLINLQLNGEIKTLEKDVKDLKKKNKELQIIIISRKLVKIILKHFITNCLKSFTREDNSNIIKTLILKECDTFDCNELIKIFNELIEKNKKSNEVMHFEGFINNNIDILKGYGQDIYLKDLINLLNITEKEKNYLNKIAIFFKIDELNVYNDIISFDPKIKDLLDDLQSKLEQQ